MTKTKTQLDPTAMTITDVVRVLVAAGSKTVTSDSIQAEIESSLPTNTDGTINLVCYIAWLVHERVNCAD